MYKYPNIVYLTRLEWMTALLRGFNYFSCVHYMGLTDFIFYFIR